MTEKTTEETRQEALASAPREEEEKEEEPVFNLIDLLKDKKAGKIGMSDVLSYAILTDIMERREDRREQSEWRREQRELQRANPASKPSPEVEALKGEIIELRKIVEGLADTLKAREQNEAQKAFVQGVVKQTTDSIMPELQAIKDKLAEYDAKMASGEKPSTSLEDIKKSLVEAIDRMGEKVGAGGKTLADVASDIDKVLALIDNVEKRLKRGEGGEVDYKTMTVSTLGEIGKELVSAYRDIATASREGGWGYQPPQQETPASTMQTIIKRQVQNYILQRMEAGATTLNVQNAAQELGLTPGQVVWAYNQLMKEGWFHVRIPQKQKQKGKKVRETVPQSETEEIGPEPSAGSEAESNVFEPPPE